jgi:hypothetical protein
MRGSPLLRTLLLLLALTATGLGLAKLAGRRPAPPAAPPDPNQAAAALSTQVVPFELRLSATPATVRLLDPHERILFESRQPATALRGTLPSGTALTAIILQVRWAASTPGHRFARLVLEPPGEPTLQHFFEAPGDLDDAWEIPPPAAHDHE